MQCTAAQTQRLALQVLHQQIVGAFLLGDAVDIAYVGMV